MKQRGLVIGFSGLVLMLLIAASWPVAEARVAQAQPPQPVTPRFAPIVQAEVRHDTSRPLRELVQEFSTQPDQPMSPQAINQVNRQLLGKALDPKFKQELIAQGKDPLTYFQQTDPVIQSVNYAAAL